MNGGLLLTRINGDEYGCSSKITFTSSHLSSLPVAIECVGGVRKQRVRHEAGPTWLNLLTLCSRPTCIVHCFLDDRLRHRRLRHAPHGRQRRPTRRRRHCRRWENNGGQEPRAWDEPSRRWEWLVVGRAENRLSWWGWNYYGWWIGKGWIGGRSG